MAHTLFIDGSSGTTGLQLRERLRPYVEAGAIALLELPESHRKDDGAKSDAMRSADLTVLCLPDDAARAAVNLAPERSRIVDTSTAHRVADGWIYGFPELNAAQAELIRNADRVSNPGCHATGAIALLSPLVNAGLIPRDYPIAITSVSGYTGAGKSAIAEYESDSRSAELDAPRAYALTAAHKHIPEIVRYAGLEHAPAFTPLICDFPQGMQVVIPLRLPGRRRDVFEALRQHYAASPNIETTDEIPAFAPSNLNAGTDKLTLRVAGSDEIVILTAQFDNLGKGAAGAAMQNIRLMLGVETI
ncbi:MAG: N-acetyl-gamma-glutamyl-phosphate reductase [Oscillospiraceae bacterium]|jgi:N-acetyl-gamma-glutamyl-phosphate reductase|nr:N-acetyl-gamma-glutamyl-phosphate reductase [Oscillospiraceae bacterium]